MKQKKLEKIKNDIILSIKYARLKAAISEEENKKKEISEKKKLIGSNDKKIERSNQFIERVNELVEKIEDNYTEESYSLITGDRLHEKLILLSKLKDFDLIKYSIAIEVIIDSDFKNTDNSGAEFLQSVSLLLFDEATIMLQMQEDYTRITKCIYGKELINFLDSTAKKVSSSTAKSFLKTALTMPQKAIAVAGGGITLGLKYLKLRNHAKMLSTLSPGELARKLIIISMNLLYAKRFFRTDMEYRNYFEYTLAEVNLERRTIMKEMFEEQFEIEANRLKIEIMHNFDNYMIEQMIQRKKEENRYA